MKTLKFAAAVLLAVLVAVPAFAQRGSADFTKFVALGDSYGAGFVSGSMNERHQPWSWPAFIARQAGLNLCPPNAPVSDPCFAQPLVSFPGIGPELQLTSLAPTIAPAAGLGQPIMLPFGRPYNNLSIPGATVGALLQLTGGEPAQANEPAAVLFGRFILRNLGGTAVDQAIAQRPTFIAIWIGGNDFLGSVLAGTDQGMTSAADFKTRYEAMLDRLIAGAPNAGMVVGTLPQSPVVAPLVATIPPFIVDPATRQRVLVNGQPIFFLHDAQRPGRAASARKRGAADGADATRDRLRVPAGAAVQRAAQRRQAAPGHGRADSDRDREPRHAHRRVQHDHRQCGERAEHPGGRHPRSLQRGGRQPAHRRGRRAGRADSCHELVHHRRLLQPRRLPRDGPRLSPLRQRVHPDDQRGLRCRDPGRVDLAALHEQRRVLPPDRRRPDHHQRRPFRADRGRGAADLVAVGAADGEQDPAELRH